MPADQPPGPWRPTASLQRLQQRAELLRSVRQFFDQRDFWEVQTPCLLPETVIDAHIDPLQLPLDSGTGFLQTSPEAAHKRLLAAGAQAIYQIGPVFRGGETGALHNPEFTMLEWYRVGDGLRAGIDLLLELAAHCLPPQPVRERTYQSLFIEHCGFDPLIAGRTEIITAVERLAKDYQVRDDDTRDDLLDVLLSSVIEPQLHGWTIISHYPISQAALARAADDDPRVAERFELWVDSTEVANGYAELTDADELDRRMRAQNAQRQQLGKPPLPNPTQLLAAMRSGLPTCSGTALGFDRLVMLACGANTLQDVLTFPWCV